MPDDLLQRLMAGLAGRYRVERQLGQGGMATVFLAHDEKHGRQVAVKVLRPAVAASLGAERFLREIQIAAQLNHPNILPLHDSGEVDGLLYYVMPYVAGETLRDRLAQDGALPLDTALSIAREVADALDYAHTAGVVHRDIKPENILIQAGHAVVSDFGIARAVAQAGSAGLTEAGIAVGTPAYMSPEQALAADDLDGRTDVYALGCVLWEMLTGAPPFTGPNPQAVLAGHAVEPVPTVSAARPALPPDLDAVLTTALAKQPAERYATAGALGAALKQVELGEATASGRATLARELAVIAGVTGLGVAVVLYLVFGAGLPYWLLAAAVIPLLLQAPFVSTGVRSLRRLVGGGGPRVTRWSRWAAVLGTAGVLVAGVGSSATVALGRAGVGPLSTLVSQGALTAHPLVVVADFESPDDDPGLGPMLAGSLRDYWVQAEAFEVVDQERMREYLLAMQRNGAAPIDREAADEIAERAGAEAMIVGAVNRVGTAYEVGVRVIATPSLDLLLADREPAPDVGGLLAARDRLAKRLERALGEPLATVRARPAPMQVTTRSIEALRIFEAQRSVWQEDRDEAIRMLEQALELDPEFTMARAVLAKFLTWSHRYREAQVQLQIACNDRGRMVLERLEGDLHRLNCLRFVDGSRQQAQQWAEVLRQRYPDQPLITYTNMLMWDGDWEGAAESGRADRELFDRVLEAQGGFRDQGDEVVHNVIAGNLHAALLATHQFEAADSLFSPWWRQVRTAYASREYDRAAALLESNDSTSDETERRNTLRLALARGKLESAEPGLRESGGWWDTRNLVQMEAWLRGDTAAARVTLDAFTDAADLSDPSEILLLSLARWSVDAGDANRARSFIRDYEARFPEGSRDHLFEYGHARAGVALLEGRPLEAAARLRTAYGYRSSEVNSDPGWDTYYHIGRAFEAAQLPDSAIAAYERAVAHPGSLDDYFVFPLATGRLADLYDARADTANALKHYRMLAHVWKDADPELQPRVAHARERIAALGR